MFTIWQIINMCFATLLLFSVYESGVQLYVKISWYCAHLAAWCSSEVLLVSTWTIVSWNVLFHECTFHIWSTKYFTMLVIAVFYGNIICIRIRIHLHKSSHHPCLTSDCTNDLVHHRCSYYTKTWTKWPPFSHGKNKWMAWKVKFNALIKILFLSFVQKYFSGSDNGLAAVKRQVIT